MHHLVLSDKKMKNPSDFKIRRYKYIIQGVNLLFAPGASVKRRSSVSETLRNNFVKKIT